MVTKRKATKKSVTKKGSTKKVVHKTVTRKPILREKEPEYMVNINEPKLLRKDLLETLREVIIFMQSYERFKQVQDDKIALFTKLKSDIKELNNVIDNLKKHFPKGKLDAVTRETEFKKPIEDDFEVIEEEKEVIPVKTYRPEPIQKPKSELDELEDQLKDIESQLRGMN